MCVQVVEVVKDLARSGITICSTIHSPTPRCFSLFDHVLILLRGHLVYDGSPGAARLAICDLCGSCQQSSRASGHTPHTRACLSCALGDINILLRSHLVYDSSPGAAQSRGLGNLIQQLAAAACRHSSSAQGHVLHMPL